MRVTQIHVKDAKTVAEYAYHEDRNLPCRQEMEDSSSHPRQTSWLRTRSYPAWVSSPFWTATGAAKSQTTWPANSPR